MLPGLFRHPRKSVYGTFRSNHVGIPRAKAGNNRGVQCGTAPLSLRAQGRHSGFSRPVPCLVQSAHTALGTAQGDQRSRVPDRTAGPRLAHAARLSALADTALIHGRCRALASLDTPDPEHCVPRDRPARVCKDELPHFDRSPQSNVLATRKPTLNLWIPMEYPRRFAERASLGLSSHEPPRNTRRPQPPPVTHALPSDGAPEQTRPWLLPRYLVLRAADDSHGEDGATPLAPRCLARPRDDPRHARLALPSCGSPAPSAQTLVTTLPDSVPFEPAQPSDAGTPARTAVLTSAWWIPPPQRVRCPRIRINSRPGPFLPRRPRRLSTVEKTRPPRFLDDPCVHAPLFDPGGPPAPGHYRADDAAFRWVNDVGSAWDTFEAQSAGLHALCVRFAAGVTPGPRNTRFRLVASLDRSGLSPAGSRRRFPSCPSFTWLLPSPDFAWRNNSLMCGREG